MSRWWHEEVAEVSYTGRKLLAYAMMILGGVAILTLIGPLLRVVFGTPGAKGSVLGWALSLGLSALLPLGLWIDRRR